MKSFKTILFFWLFGSAIAVAGTEALLFFEDFASWTQASDYTTLKTQQTAYGTVKYLSLKIEPATEKGWKLQGTDELFTGYAEFKKGSTTINTDNSYLELPPLAFLDGGVVSIVYGAGSINKKMRLQEWSGTAWVNATYAEISTAKSSCWYRQDWQIEGSGTKTLRLVLSTSGNLLVAEVRVTTNKPSIDIENADTLDFGSGLLSDAFPLRSFKATGKLLSAGIAVDAGETCKLSEADNGVFYNSIYLPADGGDVYVKFQPQTIGECVDSVLLSSFGAENRKVYLKAQVSNTTDYLQASETAGINLSQHGNVLQITDIAPHDYALYTISGQLFDSGKTGRKTMYISLPTGVFVLRIGNAFSRKILIGQ